VGHSHDSERTLPDTDNPTPHAPRPTEFAARAEQDGNTVLVSVVGDLDVASSPAARTCFKSVLTLPAAEVVVDLGGCTFVDSMGLKTLLDLARDLPPRTLTLLPGPSQVPRVFEVSGLIDVLPFRR
jgi:anti-anti-sigma factor